MTEPVAALERALATLQGRQADPEGALYDLLEAWEELRAPALSDLIESLSAQLVSRFAPLGARSLREYHSLWLERARVADAAELGLLLASVADTTSPKALVRLRAIADHVPDPRIASTAVELIRAPPFVASSTGKFWTQLHAMLLACADPRAVTQLEAITPEPHYRSLMAERLDNARLRTIRRMRKQLEGLSVRPTPEQAEYLAELELAVNALRLHDPGQEQALLETIALEPRELGHRQVYADLLLAKGDPRGEFIALQLVAHEGKATREINARIRQLFAEHGRGWLGELGHALTGNGTAFERGFLHAAQVKLNVPKLERIVGDPLWATVASLTNAPAEVLGHPVMRSLEFVRLDGNLIIDLLASETPIASVHTLTIDIRASWRTTIFGHDGFKPRFRLLLRDTSVLPQLRHACLRSELDISSGELDWLWPAPLLSRLHSFEIRLPGATEIIAAYVYRSLRRSPTSLQRLTFVHPGLEIHFTRSAGEDLHRPWARVELRAKTLAENNNVLDQLERLRRYTELEVVSE